MTDQSRRPTSDNDGILYRFIVGQLAVPCAELGAGHRARVRQQARIGVSAGISDFLQPLLECFRRGRSRAFSPDVLSG